VNASTVYLVVSVIGALLTVLALFPGPRAGKLPALFFMSGLVVGELAPVHIAWQVLATVGFVLAGALERWPGWLGLVITLVSWAGLVLAIARAGSTVGALEDALEATLGTDYRSAIDPELREGLGEGRRIGWWQNPFRSRHKDVEKVRNISYGPAGKRNLLDVYRPRAGANGCPTLVYVHGGAWTMGSKDRAGLPLVLHLAARGWVCVTPNYRLSPKATFPDHLVDLKLVLKWIRESGGEYGADPDFVVVSGGSAGGHLSALLALTANDPEFQPGFEDVDTSVVGAVPLYGSYDLLDRRGFRPDNFQKEFLEKRVLKTSPDADAAGWEKASPVYHVRPDAPPFFVVHGRNDSLLFWEDAEAFAQALRAVSREPVVYAQLPHAQHAFDTFHSVRGVAVAEGVTRYLAWLRSTHQRRSAPIPARETAPAPPSGP
jgi:acetyl esterase/lipase